MRRTNVSSGPTRVWLISLFHLAKPQEKIATAVILIAGFFCGHILRQTVSLVLYVE
jgi:hypothetical protein